MLYKHKTHDEKYGFYNKAEKEGNTMSVKDDLGKRMKEFYENVSKINLVRRMPVAIRLDGKAFHTFTKGFKKPFDEVLIQAMQKTMKYLCENIQGCVIGYTQSDEITLILVDYKKLISSAWFDNEVQKICSISASMATLEFNRRFSNCILTYLQTNNSDRKYGDTLIKAINKGALFDSRVFNIPKEEVCNLLYWRQLDAIRNSIQMLGQSEFSHKELHNKSCNDIQDMLMIQKNINWNNLETTKKRGSCCIRNKNEDKHGWIIDNEIPIFSENRSYVEDLIVF